MDDAIYEIFSRAVQSTFSKNYVSALEDFKWLHDHPDDNSIYYKAIRRNFVLTAWVMLGMEYEPALDSLKELLEGKSTRLAAGDTNPLLPGDIDAIKSVLAKI